MAIGVLILGESGSGKSYSMRNLSPDEVKVISVEKPILPFKNHFNVTRTNDVDKIVKELKATKKKIAVIDDFQYILGLAAMRRSLEKGWDKFSEMQYDYFKILDALKDLPDDMIVYFMSHTETDENGVTKIKTIGKALDKYITIEGLFMIVLGTRVSDGNYYFITQTNGKDTLKTPAGMFPSYAIDNDLKYVDEKIRNYYEIGEFLSDEDMKEIDEAAKKADIFKDDEKPKRGRRSAKKEEPAKASEEEKEAKNDDRGASSADRTADAEGKPSESGDTGAKVAENFQSEDGPVDSPSVGVPGNEKKTRTRKTREEVIAENAEKVANAGLEEAGDKEEVPLEDVNMPDTEKPPRRTRKNRTEEPEETQPEEEKPATRRSRRIRG